MRGGAEMRGARRKTSEANEGERERERRGQGHSRAKQSERAAHYSDTSLNWLCNPLWHPSRRGFHLGQSVGIPLPYGPS